jgi:predicted RNA polymerase sigma factor
LSEEDRAILDLAGKHWRYPGAYDEQKRGLCGTAVRFDQLLAALLDRPEALAYDPLTVKRLQRIRARRRLRASVRVP